MAQEVTLGGDRLGSGKKIQQELHNYGMNSFNQNRIWWSTAAPGILYPCFKEIGTPHGTFDIDIDAFVRTLPTKGPLFGSFKMQVDLFNVPFRLYQGILHNNPTDIGLHMNQVYLPAMNYKSVDGKEAPIPVGSDLDNSQVATNSLVKYMGLSGIGHAADWAVRTATVNRKIQCVPELGYYDIFKNYYSNKQEENAYVVTPKEVQETSVQLDGLIFTYPNVNPTTSRLNIPYEGETITVGTTEDPLVINEPMVFTFLYRVDFGNYKEFELTQEIKQKIIEEQEITISYTYEETTSSSTNTIIDLIGDYTTGQKWKLNTNPDGTKTIQFEFTIYDWVQDDIITYLASTDAINFKYYSSAINLSSFALKNIDKMRSKLLALNELGDQFILDDEEADDTGLWGYDSGIDGTGLPYAALTRVTEDGIPWGAFNQVGLVTKTYQSDMFNNWLDNSLVDEISRRTKIDTSTGGFTPDTLILQEKIYTYLNRVLVGGGTYYDWQEATYGEGIARMCEIPMYIGGMSTEIMFEEVVANNESKIEDKYQALGSLAGKGRNTGRKGGTNIHVRMDEPGYIIGIMSITPRICQFQGNDWDRTELMTMDDLHKPELDGIGFQDLMVENMAWWSTVLIPGGDSPVYRPAVGKQTAWLHYQTAIDKCYGDFAKADGYGFMVLSRQYDHDPNNVFNVLDLTSYIDPVKYNYPFAYQDLDAQNFWVEIAFNCTSRRKMGAQQLPTL